MMLTITNTNYLTKIKKNVGMSYETITYFLLKNSNKLIVLVRYIFIKDIQSVFILTFDSLIF